MPPTHFAKTQSQPENFLPLQALRINKYALSLPEVGFMIGTSVMRVCDICHYGLTTTMAIIGNSLNQK